jgi:hypothetical protein
MSIRRRRIVALLGGAATLLLPFLRIGGESALRFDIPTMRLLFFGSVLWIDQFHLVLLLVLFLVLLGIGITAVFGRLWCGWLCPQTVIGEVAAWIASALPREMRRAGAKAVLAPLSALVSLSLLWYFVPPPELFRDLFRSPVLLGFFLVQWAVVYGMVGVLGTRFCGTACPYGMLQNVMAFDVGRAKAGVFAGAVAAAGLAFLIAVWAQPGVSFAVQWEGAAAVRGGNLYRYSVRNNLVETVELRLSVDRPARILGDARISVAPKSRVAGRVAVTSDAEPRGGVRFTAEGGGFRIVRMAAYP